MSIKFKFLIFLVLLFPLLTVASADDVEGQQIGSFQIARVVAPDQKQVAVQRVASEQRVVKKYVVTAAVAVSAVAAMIIFYEIRQAAHARQAELNKKAAEKNTREVMAAWVKEHGWLPVPKIPENWKPAAGNDQKSTPDKSPGWLSWGASNVKAFGWDCSKFMADSAQMLVSGIVLNGMYSFLSSKWNQAYQEETVLWYAHQKTKIPLLFNDLKSYAVDYDLYASLLSADAFNQDAQMHMKAFVTDLLGAAQDHMNNEVFKDAQYFNFLLGDMKKKYARKTGEMEKLQEYVIPAVAKKNRALAHRSSDHQATAQDHAEMLFAHDAARRKDIAHMCNLLAKEMEKLTAFIMMHGNRYQMRALDMIASCNDYLAHMELLLNSTPEKITEMSKADRGMFTSMYEYEKLFSEQINYLHRYCKLTN